MNWTLHSRVRAPRLHTLLAVSALAVGLFGASTAANATVIMSSSVGGVPTTAQHYESFDSLPLGSTGGTTATGIEVTFIPGAQAVQGAASGMYAAPFVSNGNGALFGDSAFSGADSSTYLTSGSTGSSANADVTLSFGSQQRYFGLLWGSVDDFNTLAFYSGDSLVTSFDGTDVSNSAGTGNCFGGNQGALGSCYVNINFLTGSYDRVVAMSSSYAFEFDNVAFSTSPIGVPEPGALGMMGLGLLSLGGLALRRRKGSIK
ncbi:MAG: PEP-CTERM sorting domain-containing protein [Rhodanobacter sp.]